MDTQHLHFMLEYCCFCDDYLAPDASQVLMLTGRPACTACFCQFHQRRSTPELVSLYTEGRIPSAGEWSQGLPEPVYAPAD